MKKTLEQAALLAVLLVLAGCAGNEPAEPKWEEHLYRTVVYNSGEDESDAKYLEIAQRSQKLLSLLEEKTGAFVMDAYNYQTVDDEGTPPIYHEYARSPNRNRSRWNVYTGEPGIFQVESY